MRTVHRGLVGDRRLVGTRYLADPGLRAEYHDEIAPRTGAALRRVLGKVSLQAPRRVLDLGAGTGAAGQVIVQAYPDVELVSVDKVGGVQVVTADLSRPTRPDGVEGQFDWIVAAHLLNELVTVVEDDELLQLVRFWIAEYLRRDGVLILIEPALRETSRGLLRVRDGLLADGLSVLAPCFFKGPCPALLRERDFCHDSAESIVAGRSRVDFSYVVLSRAPTHAPPLDVFRMVSDPMKDKGRLRRFGCGPAGRVVLSRLDREKTEANGAFTTIERGDILWVAGATSLAEEVRLGSDARCECLPSPVNLPSGNPPGGGGGTL